jgi:hypothetical protein
MEHRHVWIYQPETDSFLCECGESAMSFTFAAQRVPMRFVYPERVGTLTDEGFYPARVASGRELMTC